MKSNTESKQPSTETQNWLASILLKYGERIMRRFAYFYEQLQALPRQTRRVLQKQLAVPLAGAALMLALSGAPSVHAATITVDGDGTGGTCSLEDAITAANLDTATGGCAAGSGPDTIDLQVDVDLTANLPLINSVITLEGNGHTIDSLKGDGIAIQVLGIRSAGNLTLNNATITGGTHGGIISEGAVTLNNSTVSDNTGGGVYTSSTLTLNNSTVSDNTASYGGGIFSYGGTVTLNNSTVSGNTATTSGGGIYNYGTLTLNNSTVSGNMATNSFSGSVGGIMIRTGAATLNNSTVSGNTAANSSGIKISTGTTLTLNNSTVSGNTATSYAGGIFTGGTLTLNNSTVSGNTASSGSGGGIVADYSAVILNNSTISGNTAAYYGGGINQNYGSLDINRSLISGNTALYGGAEIDNYNGTVNVGDYNLFGDNSHTNAQAFDGFALSGTDITATSNGTNPTVIGSILNTVLGNHGGGTEIHHLVVNSPGIDAAPSAACVALPINNVDQRGEARNVDGLGNGDTGNECDIGAHEMQSPTAVSLQSIDVTSSGAGGIAALFSAMSLTVGTFWLRRRRAV